MNPIFKVVNWCEDDDQQQKNDQSSSLDVLGQDKVTRWMRDGIQVLYCDRLPDISSVARPIDKCGSYMDMLQLWTSDLDSSTNTRETSSESQVDRTVSLEEQQAKDVEREKAFYDSLTRAGGRPWYSRTLIAHVARNPGNYDELLQYWKKDPSGSGNGQWMVFERQLERWNLFCRYQRRARRNSDTFKEYSARCNRRLSNQLSSAALDMKQDLNDQDSLSQWLEYLCFELSECKRYSWYKRYHQHYENAWQILVDSKVLHSHESRSQVETIEYASLHNDERTSLRQAVEAASSEVLLAERDSLNPSLRGPLTQRKLFEAQANLDSAIEAFDRLQHRMDAIKKYREATSTYREARQGANRHQTLLRWVQQQIPLIEKELGLSCSTQRLTLDGDMLTETESDESDDQGDSIGSSCTSSVCEPGGLQRSESKKRCRIESISGEATQSSNNNDRPKRSRHDGQSSPLRRGSSTSHLPQPLASVTSNSTKSPPPQPTTATTTTTTAPPDIHVPPVHPSLLQPRVAVVLNVPTPWHPWLFALRLLSILPALWWGLPSAVQLLLRVLPGPEIVVVVPSTAGGSVAMSVEQDARYALTETGLATIWCFASGYLSFFFTDCLMSRWLINYTPQATMVRLLTTNICNAYLTQIVLSIAGGFEDPRLFLPGWIGIATTLTVMYHITHQKINIRKETSTSINVFSIASFFSMVTLLAHMHQFTPEYPQMPIVTNGRRAWDEASRVVAQVRGSVEQHNDL